MVCPSFPNEGHVHCAIYLLNLSPRRDDLHLGSTTVGNQDIVAFPPGLKNSWLETQFLFYAIDIHSKDQKIYQD